MLKSVKNFSVVILSFCGLSCLLYSCDPVGEELRMGQANLRIINAAPDANEYSFFLNDTLKTGQALKFGEGSAYLPVSAGTNNIVTKVNDMTISNTHIDLFLQQSTNYTLFLAGIAAKDSLIYISTLDKNQILSDTMATVRFINVSPDATNLNLVFQKDLVDSVGVISSISYRTASQYVKVKPLNYFLRVKKTAGAERLANLDNYKLEAGKIYTFWTKGLVNDSGQYALELKVLQDN